jgi:hypothetical protein
MQPEEILSRRRGDAEVSMEYEQLGFGFLTFASLRLCEGIFLTCTHTSIARTE